MANLTCNISESEQFNRKVIGAILIVAAILGFGRGFLLLAGAVLVVEGFIGWCGVPYLAEKFKKK